MFLSLTPHQAHELISRGDVEVVDVRDPAEWSGGHIAGARLLPLEQLRASPRTLLDRPSVLFVCTAGVRSQTAARVAAGEGLATVYSLTGGLRAWVNAGFSLVEELSVAV